jgi:tripartite-type tricarboxylate transporter receptor subunit TctC
VKHFLAATGGALVALSAACVNAQDRAVNYPQKPVRIVAGSAPGGAVDFIGRLAAQKLTEVLGHVAKAAPDGYTLSSASMATLCVVPYLYAKIGYDSLKDFAEIIRQDLPRWGKVVRAASLRAE